MKNLIVQVDRTKVGKKIRTGKNAKPINHGLTLVNGLVAKTLECPASAGPGARVPKMVGCETI